MPPANVEAATFAIGDLNGLNVAFATEFAAKNPNAIVDMEVGYMADGTKVAQIKFDKTITNYEQLVKFFYTFHDPTVITSPGINSGIFHHSEE